MPQAPGQRFGNPEDESEEEEELWISVYPNPNDGDLSVLITGTGQNDQTYALHIKDVLGKDVFEAVLRFGKNQLKLPMAAGSYLYTISKRNGELKDQGNIVVVQE